ncbi:MAG: autotransporter outer membrane beta-barrel domain-containing protein [Plesiomonas shigelloides]
MNYLVRGGYSFQPNSRYQVTPFVALNYNDTKWNGYQETGDGAFLATFRLCTLTLITSIRLTIKIAWV